MHANMEMLCTVFFSVQTLGHHRHQHHPKVHIVMEDCTPRPFFVLLKQKSRFFQFFFEKCLIVSIEMLFSEEVRDKTHLAKRFSYLTVF